MTAADLLPWEIEAPLVVDAFVEVLLDISGLASLSIGALDQQVAHAHQIVGG